MRERSDPSVGGALRRGRALARRRALAALALAAGLGAGCQSTPPWLYSSGADGTGGPATQLEFDAWRKDTLHCDGGRCLNEYLIEVDEPARVRAEVYAPLGGGPEFALTLLDAAGEEIARPKDDDALPRRLEYRAEPGVYRLRIVGRGDDGGPLRYDVVAFREPAGGAAPTTRPPPPIVRKPSAAPPRQAAPSVPPPAPVAPSSTEPPSGDVLVEAEVLDIEVDPAGASFVLLDVGEPQGVRKAMRGGLRDRGREIGAFVIVEVYRDGSRARVEGELSGEIGIDTIAVVYR